MTPNEWVGLTETDQWEEYTRTAARLAAAEAERDRAVAAAMVAQAHTDESLRLANEYRQRLAAAEAARDEANRRFNDMNTPTGREIELMHDLSESRRLLREARGCTYHRADCLRLVWPSNPCTCGFSEWVEQAAGWRECESDPLGKSNEDLAS